MQKRLMNFITTNNLPFAHQLGFQANRTTLASLLDIYSKLVCMLNIFRFLTKLENYAIIGLALNWFKSYLGKCTQIVKLNNVYSSQCEIMWCTTRECAWTTTVYNIHDIFHSSKLFRFHFFAGDYGVIVSMLGFHCSDRGSNSSQAAKFHNDKHYT